MPVLLKEIYFNFLNGDQVVQIEVSVVLVYYKDCPSLVTMESKRKYHLFLHHL